jgi:hypothetical protein
LFLQQRRTWILLAIFAVSTSALVCALQIRSKTFAIFPNASIVLACASETELASFDLKRIRTFFQRLLHRREAQAFIVLFGVAATDARAHIGLAHFAIVETGAIQLEALRTNAVAKYLTRWKTQKQWVANFTRVSERTRIPGQDTTNRFGASTVGTALDDGILTVHART